MKKQNKNTLIKILLLLFILFVIFLIFFLKKDRIKRVAKKEVNGEQLITLCNLAYKNNVKNNKNKKILKIIKENNDFQIDDKFLGNYPNNVNSVIINIKINDKTYNMREIIQIGPDKLLENYKKDMFERKIIAKHDNKKISFIYYELKTK